MALAEVKDALRCGISLRWTHASSHWPRCMNYSWTERSKGLWSTRPSKTSASTKKNPTQSFLKVLGAMCSSLACNSFLSFLQKFRRFDSARREIGHKRSEERRAGKECRAGSADRPWSTATHERRDRSDISAH